LSNAWARWTTRSAWSAVRALPLLLLGAAAACSGGRDSEPDFSAPDLAGGDLVVAEVSGRPVTAGELYHKIRLQFPQMPREGPGLGLQAKELAPAVVDERCLVRYGQERGFDREPDCRRTLEFSRRFIVNRVVERSVAERTAPSEEELRAFYEENVDQFTMPEQIWYHQMQVDSQAAAEQLRRQLLAGADFEELARKASRDAESADRGGRMPPFRDDGSPTLPNRYPQLLAALRGMSEGEVSAPVRTELGWHLLRCDGRREKYAKLFEEVREGIFDKLARPREADGFSSLLDSLKLAYQVKIYEDNLEKFYLLQMDAEQIFQSARAERDGKRRVGRYAEILARFPESERAPEALFMMGFEYAENLGDRERAREAFERFLAEHPDHALAASAQTMLAGLSGSPAPAESPASPGSTPPSGR